MIFARVAEKPRGLFLFQSAEGMVRHFCFRSVLQIPSNALPTFAKRHEQIEAPKARRREACTKARRNVEQLKVTKRCEVDLKQKWQARRDSAKSSFSRSRSNSSRPWVFAFRSLHAHSPSLGGRRTPFESPSYNFFPNPRAVPQRPNNCPMENHFQLSGREDCLSTGLEKSGRPGGTRTHNTLIWNQMLYQLELLAYAVRKEINIRKNKKRRAIPRPPLLNQ